MKAVIKKELADHFGSARFLLVVALVFMISLAAANMAGSGIADLLSQGAGDFLAGRAFLLLFTVQSGFISLLSFLSYFGPLMALILGFDAINRERNQGTLSKILSQPIYRDEVILGKFLASFITLSIMITALLLLVSALGLVMVGVAPTGDEVFRLGLFWIISLLYVGLWLGLAMFMSVICRNVATSAMGAAALWIFLTFFVPILASGTAGIFYPINNPYKPAAEEIMANDRFYRRALLASPTQLYNEAASLLLDPSLRGSGQAARVSSMSKVDRYLFDRFQSTLPVWQTIILIIPHILLLIGWILAASGASYLKFMRMEIRSV